MRCAPREGMEYVYLPKVQMSAETAPASITNGVALGTQRTLFVLRDRNAVCALLERADSLAQLESELTRMADAQAAARFELAGLASFKIHDWWFDMVSVERPDGALHRLIIAGRSHKAAFKHFYRQLLTPSVGEDAAA